MSLLGAIGPMMAARGDQAARNAETAAKDAVTARVIVGAEEAGNPAAAQFAGEARHRLIESRIRRARARRLRAGAARAASVGLDQLSAFGADAALAEDLAANRLQGAVCAAVRSSYGGSPFFMSPEESRLMAQKASFDNLSQAGLEKAFSSMLDRSMASSQNYGDDDLQGDEKDDGAVSRIGTAAECFGGDLPNLLGTDCYGRISGVFKASKEQLQKRLAKRQERLAKLQEKLESKEDDDKKGGLLQFRIKQIQKSIKRIKAKLQKLSVADRQVAASAADAQALRTSEVAAPGVPAPVSDEGDGGEEGDDDLPGSDDDVLGGIDLPLQQQMTAALKSHHGAAYPFLGEDVAAELGEDADVLGGDAVGGDEEIGAWFRRPLHRSPRRRIERRWGRRAGLGPVPMPYEVPVAVPVPVESEDDGQDEGGDGEAEFGGDPLLGFFEARAASYGATAQQMQSKIVDNEGDAFGGFFDAITDFFSSVFTPKRHAAAHPKHPAHHRLLARRHPAQIPAPVPAPGHASAPAPAWSRVDLVQIQNELKRLGAYSIAVDGKYGPGTRAGLDKIFGSSVWMRWAAGSVIAQLRARGRAPVASTADMTARQMATQAYDSASSAAETTPRQAASRAWAAMPDVPGVDVEELFAGDPGALEAFVRAKSPAERQTLVAKYIDRVVADSGLPGGEDDDLDDGDDGDLDGDGDDSDLDGDGGQGHGDLPDDDSDLMPEGA